MCLRSKDMKISASVFVIFVSCVLIFQLTCGKQAIAAVEPNTPTPQSVNADANAGSVSGPNAAPVSDPNAPQPIIKIESALYDFGDVGTKTTNICQFKFTNIGKGTLIIKNIRSTCGCTVPALQKLEYAPGESGSIEVRFTTPGTEGEDIKHLYIESNDKQNPEAELTVRAEVIAKVKVEPRLIKLSLKEENAACPPIKLSSTDNVPFVVTRFEATANCLTADFGSIAAATEIVLKPKVDTDTLRRVLSGTITIGLNHPQCSEVFVNFEATPVYNLNPPMIMILNARPETAVSREVWVLNNYKEPFEIESVTSQKGMAKLASKELHENGYRLVIDLTPPVSKSKIRIFSDTIFINIKGGEKLEINCRGFYEKDQKEAAK